MCVCVCVCMRVCVRVRVRVRACVCDVAYIFVQEYDNGMEEVISEIAVGADEEEVERELKLAHIDIYNKGLTERERRKRYMYGVCVCVCL